MKISTIEPFIVSHHLKEKFYFSQWQYDTRMICLVKIHLQVPNEPGLGVTVDEDVLRK